MNPIDKAFHILKSGEYGFHPYLGGHGAYVCRAPHPDGDECGEELFMNEDGSGECPHCGNKVQIDEHDWVSRNASLMGEQCPMCGEEHDGVE